MNATELITFQPSAAHYATKECRSKDHGTVFEVSYSGVPEFFLPESSMAWLKQRFATFWCAAGANLPVPQTASEAVERAREELRLPKKITYKRLRYPEILSKEY
jgi:hypothetical protein